VTVVASDMRVWKAPELADILVSELLGSFGDNELSPECLDGAQRFLKPGGISIPCDSTSFISPISSSKLWSDVKAFDKYQEIKHFETSYVVKMHRFHEMAPAQKCFYFIHPNTASYPPISHQMELEQADLAQSLGQEKESKKSTLKKVGRGASRQRSESKSSKRQRERGQDSEDNDEDENEKSASKLLKSTIELTDEKQRSSKEGLGFGPLGYGEKVIDNNRYTTMVFDIKTANTIYGFAGYFESRLYKDVFISIHPPTYSIGMFSWFPLYFPISEPVYVPKDTKIRVHFWRNVSEEQHKVWYEWSFEDVNPRSGISSVIHNPSGRSSHIKF